MVSMEPDRRRCGFSPLSQSRRRRRSEATLTWPKFPGIGRGKTFDIRIICKIASYIHVNAITLHAPPPAWSGPFYLAPLRSYRRTCS